jgi:hypothetical protein
MDYKSSIFEKESIVDLGDFELPGYGGHIMGGECMGYRPG